MPMLSSFAGKGEFHIAIETYLDSAYNLKPSTLRVHLHSWYRPGVDGWRDFYRDS